MPLPLLLLLLIFLFSVYKACTRQFEEGWTWVDKIGLTFLGYVFKIWAPIILITDTLQMKSQNAISFFDIEQKINYVHIFARKEVRTVTISSSTSEHVIFLKYKGKYYECNCFDVICTYPLTSEKRLFFIKEATVQFEKENSRFKFMTYDRCKLNRLVFANPDELKSLLSHYEKYYKIKKDYNPLNLDNGILIQ
ncbi:hypothetical protein SAMN02746062_00697 [Alysiella filiformis DSM 16848]|uniref:Uncharacterized protein n=2 Tax=Alysiella TaxID=194195 RepID=A0A286E6Z2_9NEIS|nr:hypothetical protein SAMN02746062_00697 [Alysiella filiformis DSM 16848]